MSTITINYTSGTTGQPKGVMYSHRGARLNALGEIIHQRLDPESIYLWTLPMFHCTGWCMAWAVTGIGATHVCLRAVRAEVIWRLFDGERVTHLAGAPTVLATIADAPQAHPLEQGLVATVSGAPPGPKIFARMRDLGARIVHVYGMTEVYGPYTVNEWQPAWAALDIKERTKYLHKVAKRIRERGQELLHTEVIDTGNTITKMKADIEGAAEQLEWYSGLAIEMKGDTVPASSNSNPG